MAERTVPEVGKKAPAFALPNEAGEKVTLADLTGQWKVLYFYPKDDTPGCTTEACDFTDGLKSFETLNATVLGVSPDSVQSHQKFRDKYDLKVTLLSDPEKGILEKYGAFGTKKTYGIESLGVIRSTFLIDPDNKIAHAWPNVKAKGHAEQVMLKLKDLTG